MAAVGFISPPRADPRGHESCTRRPSPPVCVVVVCATVAVAAAAAAVADVVVVSGAACEKVISVSPACAVFVNILLLLLLLLLFAVADELSRLIAARVSPVNQRWSMAPSVDKQTPTKMVLPSEEKPMEICATVSENALFPRDYEYYKTAVCGFEDEPLVGQSPPHDSYDQLHLTCAFVARQFVEDEDNRRAHQWDVWYAELMRGALRGDIAINGGVDAIRQTPLQLTVRRGDYETMRHLLRRGASADAHDATGKTALHVAAELGDERAAEILLEHGASARRRTERGFDAAVCAVQSGCAPLVRMLLASGARRVDDLVEDRDVGRHFSLLHCAVECNNLMMVHLLVQCQADVNQYDSYGYSCLHLACRLGHIEIVELLLQHGARVNDKSSSNMTALLIAVKNGHVDIAELLLHHGASNDDRGPAGSTPLHYAIKHGEPELIRALLRRGAHVDAANRFGQSPLYFAISSKNWSALELLLEHGADVNARDALGKTTLHAAIEAGRREICEALLVRAADVDARDNLRQSPLHYAVKQGYQPTVELLLRHRANVNARDDAQQTPLHLAVRFGHVGLFGLMLRYNVDVDARDMNGLTPLHLAVLSEQAKLIYYGYSFTFFHELLSSGAGVRARTTTTGETPLYLAVKMKCPTFAKRLLCRGSEVDAVDSVDEKTPLRVAVENDDVECVELLLTFGADVGKMLASGPRISRSVARTLARHFVRRHVAGLSVDPRFTSMFGGDEQFARQCDDEVKKMKLTRIHNEHTYYDFLRGNRRCLVNFVANAEVRGAFETETRTRCHADESAIRRHFPAFADALERNYNVGARYAPVLGVASESLGELLELPAVPIETILEFLDDDDMRNVVRAVPSLAS